MSFLRNFIWRTTQGGKVCKYIIQKVFQSSSANCGGRNFRIDQTFSREMLTPSTDNCNLRNTVFLVYLVSGHFKRALQFTNLCFRSLALSFNISSLGAKLKNRQQKQSASGNLLTLLSCEWSLGCSAQFKDKTFFTFLTHQPQSWNKCYTYGQSANHEFKSE